MTYVMNIAAASLNSNNSLKFWTIEVITFDNESVIVEVEARTAEEAQAKAADEVGNADYTMVQGCFAGW